MKEFYNQLSDYPWQFRILYKKGGLGSILSLSVEVKEFNVIYHVTVHVVVRWYCKASFTFSMGQSICYHAWVL